MSHSPRQDLLCLRTVLACKPSIYLPWKTSKYTEGANQASVYLGKQINTREVQNPSGCQHLPLKNRQLLNMFRSTWGKHTDTQKVLNCFLATVRIFVFCYCSLFVCFFSFFLFFCFSFLLLLFLTQFLLVK